MRLFSTFILCLSYLFGNAQYQERQANLTNRDGEVRQGTVRYYDWNQNPTSVVFTENSTGLPQTIAIRVIKRLAINDGPVYEGLYLKVPSYAKGPIEFSSELIQRIDSTYYLAELVLDSEPVKLYQIFDANNQDRFVLSKADSLIMLNDIHTKLIKRDAIFDYAVPEYRETLKIALSECPTLNTDNTVYAEKELTNLIKEYLAFCRIDAKVFGEKKKTSKVLFGLGVFGSAWQLEQKNLNLIGVSAQLLMPKQFHNTFILIDLGSAIQYKQFDVPGTQMGVYGGSYFGVRDIQFKAYTGLSTALGPLDTGVGIGYRKMVSAEVRYPIILSALNGFKDDEGSPVNPIFNLRAVIPLGKWDRN